MKRNNNSRSVDKQCITTLRLALVIYTQMKKEKAKISRTSILVANVFIYVTNSYSKKFLFLNTFRNKGFMIIFSDWSGRINTK